MPGYIIKKLSILIAEIFSKIMGEKKIGVVQEGFRNHRSLRSHAGNIPRYESMEVEQI